MVTHVQTSTAPQEKERPTIASREREVPVSIDPVLTGEDRVADESVARVALERYRLAHAVVGVDHVPVLERRRVRAVLQLVG